MDRECHLSKPGKGRLAYYGCVAHRNPGDFSASRLAGMAFGNRYRETDLASIQSF
jgi:hypothetical protein